MRDYAKETAKREAKELAVLKKKAPKFPVPAGFVAGWSGDEFVIKKEGDVEFHFHAWGDGTTRFKLVNGGWRTFDRTGVESSFYWRPYDKSDEVDLSKMYEEHFERIAKSREFDKTAIPIPGVGGHRTSPAGLEKLKADLKRVGYVMFHPAGFGTGYRVTKKTTRGYGERAKAETEKFFGVSPLFIETMDCD